MPKKVSVKIKVLPGGRMPEKKTEGAAAWDCYARVAPSDGNNLVDPVYDPRPCFDYYGTYAAGIIVRLGFALELPPGYHAEIFPRSSIGTQTDFRIANGAGIIDSDYRGEVGIILDKFNLDNNGTLERQAIADGDRIAQMLIVKDPDVELVPADTLSETKRGTRGFGSTGR